MLAGTDSDLKLIRYYRQRVIPCLRAELRRALPQHNEAVSKSPQTLLGWRHNYRRVAWLRCEIARQPIEHSIAGADQFLLYIRQNRPRNNWENDEPKVVYLSRGGTSEICSWQTPLYHYRGTQGRTNSLCRRTYLGLERMDAGRIRIGTSCR